ncbi:hypothetical protein AB0L82_36145 [Nocardia sp. NPDC052001]|uniref:hypothetical protein n=1 Tax=Nocardia sp. NPDC052001 TaxID=3154853 RepID=UPI00341289BA
MKRCGVALAPVPGGMAVWTASWATGYAPELDHRGAVATASKIVAFLQLVGPSRPAYPRSRS